MCKHTEAYTNMHIMKCYIDIYTCIHIDAYVTTYIYIHGHTHICRYGVYCNLYTSETGKGPTHGTRILQTTILRATDFPKGSKYHHTPRPALRPNYIPYNYIDPFSLSSHKAGVTVLCVCVGGCERATRGSKHPRCHSIGIQSHFKAWYLGPGTCMFEYSDSVGLLKTNRARSPQT